MFIYCLKMRPIYGLKSSSIFKKTSRIFSIDNDVMLLMRLLDLGLFLICILKACVSYGF